MAKRKRKLKNLKISEVSLVDKPANMESFLFVKSAGSVVTDNCAPGFELVSETINGPTDEAIDAAVDSAIAEAMAMPGDELDSDDLTNAVLANLGVE